MLFKTNIEIVTGFLGAGKTKFINSLLENTIVKDEKIVIIQCEAGQTEIKDVIKENINIIVKNLHSFKLLNSELINEIINTYKPYRIIIEKNGTIKLEQLLMMLEEKKLKHICKVTSIFHLTDAKTFEIYIQNMGNLLMDSIYNSHLIVVTNIKRVSKEELKKIIYKLEGFNQEAYIIKVNNIDGIGSVLKTKKILFNGFIKELDVTIKNLCLNSVNSAEKVNKSKNNMLSEEALAKSNEITDDEVKLTKLGDSLTKLLFIALFILFIIVIYHQIVIMH